MNKKLTNVSSTLFQGRITEMQCITFFLELGYIVSSPELPCPYDFLLDVGDKILKIQVKTCHLTADNSCLEFNTSSMTHNSKGYVNRIYDKTQVDYFSTFYNGKCYLIPFEECGNYGKKLRLCPTKNGQVKGIYFAKDYLAEEVLNNR